MANEVDYLPFATGDAANVIDQTTYSEATWVPTGFETGIADSNQLNKVWRQASMVAAAVANFISNTLNISIYDDGNLTGLIANLTSAISFCRPGRVFTGNSGALAISATTDYAIAVQRSSPSAINQVINLPSGVLNNQEFKIQDVSGNFEQYPMLLTPPAGISIGGLPNGTAWPLSVNRGTWTVHYYAGISTFGIERSAS